MNENLRNTTKIIYTHYNDHEEIDDDQDITIKNRMLEPKPQNNMFSMILVFIFILGLIVLAYQSEITQFINDHPIPTSEVQSGGITEGKIVNSFTIDHEFMVYSNCDQALINSNNGVIYQAGTYYCDQETNECYHLCNENVSGGWIAKWQISN